jgi:hypothetical protein
LLDLAGELTGWTVEAFISVGLLSFLETRGASNERNVSISTTILTWRSTTSRELTAIVSQAPSDAGTRVTA